MQLQLHLHDKHELLPAVASGKLHAVLQSLTLCSMFAVGQMTLAIIRGLRFLSYKTSTVIPSG